jgi:hypothetical protein
VLQAKFVQTKTDLASGSETVTRLLKAWTEEFEARDAQRKSLNTIAKPAARVTAGAEPQAIPSDVKSGVDLGKVSDAINKLKLLSEDIKKADIPDIKIATVEVGPILRWLVTLVTTPAENKVVIFDNSATALIEGPIVSDNRTILELDPPATGNTSRTAVQLVEPVAYQILFSKLASGPQKINFVSWTALRDFVRGAKSMSELITEPQPSKDKRDQWNKQVGLAADSIAEAGKTARNWEFISLAAFLYERAEDFDDSIGLLDAYGELAKDPDADKNRQARLEYLQDRRVEVAVAHALAERKTDGSVFATTAKALSALPRMTAAQKLHRLDPTLGGQRVKVAIISTRSPAWFGIGTTPDPSPSEFLDRYTADLAQIVQSLSPSADIVFVPLLESDGSELAEPTLTSSALIDAMNMLSGRADVPIILLPFGPLSDEIIATVISRVTGSGHLVIVPAGNEGVPGLMSASIAGTALVAEAIEPDGTKSSFSSKVPGSLGAVGDLPTVVLTDAGPTVAVGSGTSNAAAALAAIAAETVSRQPDLKGAALRKALIAAARAPQGDGAPIARVAIPR